MTTIAYRDGVIAADTQVSAGGARVGRVQKVHNIRGVLVGASGTLSVCQRFTDWVRGGCKGDAPALKDEDGDGSEAFMVVGDHIVSFGKHGPDVICADKYASGSGWHFALGAMEAGASAEDAVRIAMRLDSGSGGEVTVLRR